MRQHLTPAGVQLVVVGMAGVAAGVALHNRVFLALGAAALGAVAAAAVQLARRPRLLVVPRLDAAQVARGSRGAVHVDVTNVGRVRSEPFSARLVVAGESVHVDVDGVGPGTTTSARATFPARQRGVHEIGPAVVTREDALGTVIDVEAIGGSAALRVVPCTYSARPVAPPRSRRSGEKRVWRSPRGSTAFDGVREYVPGDDIRHIHWTTTARTGTPIVREYVDPPHHEPVIALDTAPSSLSAEAFEEAVDVVASLVRAHATAGVPVRLVTTGGVTMAVRPGRDGVGTAYHLLTEVRQDTAARGGRSVDEVARWHAGGCLVIVTGGAHRAASGELQRLRRLFPLVVVVTVDGRPPADVPNGVVVVPGDGAFDAVQRWNRAVAS